jgi:urease accessory protein
MTWHAQLHLTYEAQAALGVEPHRTVARHQHTGPLRILQSLYPEGQSICHNVLVHPPGGLVGGDTLEIDIQVQSGAHGLITTPGATRFYRSDSALALQHTRIRLQRDSRLEWLPLENIAYPHCQAENRLEMYLEPGAELMGWDLTALGLPQANLPFDAAQAARSGHAAGQFVQHMALADLWLERGRISADDDLLLNSPLGLAGQRCLASIFWVTGSPLSRTQKEQALDLARAVVQGDPLARRVGVTSPHPQVVVARVLSPLVEPAMQLLRRIRVAWRASLWSLGNEHPPRIWGT